MNAEFLSGEASASPAVAPMLDAARRLDAAGYGTGFLAARNGPRTTTHASAPLGLLSDQDFVEVADYDPHLDRLLCIGRREPHAHAGMQALVLRAKREVNAVVMVDVGGRAVGVARADRGKTQLDNAMRALEALRGTDAAQLGPLLVVTGPTPERAAERALALLGGGA